MATYFHGGNNNNNSGSSDIHHHQSSAEGGGLQTLFLMNPNNYVPFSSDTAQNPTPNMLFLNPNNSTTTPHALNLASLSHAPPQQQIIGVASNNILGSAGGGNEISGFHGFVGPTPRVHHYNWGSIMDQTALSSSSSSVVAATVTVLPNSYSEHTVTAAATEMGFHSARGHQSHHHPQGLSLSLSSQQLPFRSFSNAGGPLNSSIQSVVLGSKFLKVAQELLDEAVNVGNDNKVDYSNNKEKMKGNKNVESTSDGGGDDNRSSGGGGGDGENSGGDNKQGSELNTAQRQELHMNKSKLVTMLDEVEQRYREYKQQMQIVTSSFEEAAGYGAARTYTALALKTISKQFRCLKDAISLQIKTTGKTLGEDNCMGVKVEGSRLRFIDHNLRQQRALQQLGMIQHNAWRPQRGLPERAVSILRAWLFEHFLHPYPKDSDKVMLARQTGLTRSQVSNWFINARVRLWKPMVEEMYLEEIKDQEHNNNNGSQDDDDDIDTTNKKKKLIKESSNKELWSSSSSQLEQPPCSSSAIRLDHLNSNQNTTTPITEISANSNNNSISTSPLNLRNPHHEIMNSPGSILSVDMEMKPIRETNSNNNNNHVNFGIELGNPNKDGYPLMASFGNENHNGGGGSGSGSGYGSTTFSMEDIGRFHQQLVAPRFHGNGVSLTLGLPPSDNNNTNNNFPSQQVEFLSSHNMHLGGGGGGGGRIHHHHHEIEAATNDDEFCGMKNNATTPSSHSGTSYDHNNNNIDMQNRKRFASHQLLRDFVA